MDSDVDVIALDGGQYEIEEYISDETDTESDQQAIRKRKKKGDTSKTLRNSGLTYVNSKQKTVLGKQFKNYACHCNNNCHQKIFEASRQKAFQTFWSMGCFTKQNIYLCGLVQQNNVKKSNIHKKLRRNVFNTYRLQTDSGSVKVCKPYFLKTFQISNGRLTRALLKQKKGQELGSDGRGRHTPFNKVSEENMDVIRDHISSFPCYQSHYTRTKNPNRMYLSGDLNVRLMYNLYKTHCNNIHKLPVSELTYRRTFNNEFNLYFHSPVKDTCSKCDSLSIKITAAESEAEKELLQFQHNFHLENAEIARSTLRTHAIESQENESIYTFTFDLEKALPFPVLTTSLAYYKRNMYVYNFGCHDLRSGTGYMYVWDETVASRGSQEVGSCVLKHLQLKASDAQHVIMFSDACTGQNRNIKIVLFLLKFLDNETNNVKTIDHKFMVSGHSYLPNDADFGSIEKYLKKQKIYVPRDYYKAIANCRKKKPFQVIEMQQSDIKSVANLEKYITRRNKNTNDLPVSWLKMQWIRVVRGEPFTIYYKETLDTDTPFFMINLRPNKIGRPLSLGKLPELNLYQTTRPITYQKKKDMIDLLPYIPPIYHVFFLNLSTEAENNIVRDSGPLQCFDLDGTFSE